MIAIIFNVENEWIPFCLFQLIGLFSGRLDKGVYNDRIAVAFDSVFLRRQVQIVASREKNGQSGSTLPEMLLKLSCHIDRHLLLLSAGGISHDNPYRVF